MTKPNQIRLSDTQLIVLSGAAQRNDGALSLPDRLKGMAAQKLATGLISKGLAREVRAKADMPVWRRDEHGRSLGLMITKAGRAAIHVGEDGPEAAAAANAPGSASPGAAQPFGDARGYARRLSPEPAAAGHSGIADEPNINGYSSHRAPREGSKLAAVIALLARERGASIDDLIAATGWLPHTTRAALTGLRKRGYAVLRKRTEEGSSVYCLEGTPSARAA